MEPITLRQIEFALAVEQAGAICAAAQLLRVAQPSVSQQILALEREVGTQLFQRTATGSPPTEAGRVFLDEARQALGAVRRARAASINPQHQAGDRRLVIGVERIAITGLVAEALRRTKDDEPELVAQVLDFGTGREVTKALQSGAIDLAICSAATSWRGAQVPLGLDEYVVIPPSGHPLAGTPTIELNMLRDEPWIASPVTASLLDDLSGRAIIAPSFISHATSIDSAQELALAGVGFALVPERLLRPEAVGTAGHTTPRILRKITAAHNGSVTEIESLFLASLIGVSWHSAGVADWIF